MGSAHISSLSASLASNLVTSSQPDAVFVELDAKRVRNFRAPQSSVALFAESRVAGSEAAASGPRFPNLTAVLGNLLGRAISSMYKSLDSSGFASGSEFTAAILAASELPVPARIILGDRDVDVTLRRLADAIRRTDLKAVDMDALDASVSSGLGVPLPPAGGGDLNKEDLTALVETLKTRENVDALMSTLRSSAPLIYAAMVEERDAYMAEGIDGEEGSKRMVCVVGVAHLRGIEEGLVKRGWRRVGQCAPTA